MKLGEVVVGIVDFFASLVPGAVVVLVLALFASSSVDGVKHVVGDGEGLALAFAAVAYVVGALLNGIGSWALDQIYDVLYAPGHGLLSGPAATHVDNKSRPVAKAEGDSGFSATWHRWMQACARVKNPLLRVVTGVTEDSAERVARIATEIGAKTPTRTFQFVRATLRHSMPAAFEDIERLEAEQKLMRTAVVGAVFLGTLRFWHVLPVNHHIATVALVVAALAFARYVALRRKTVTRAYTYWETRPKSNGPDSPKNVGSTLE